MSGMERREFLRASAAALLAAGSSRISGAETGADAPAFSTANLAWQRAYDRALQVLAANVQLLPRYDAPVLIEGANYNGIWQECGPHEALVYSLFRPDVARNSHLTFFALQREDGQLPAGRDHEPGLRRRPRQGLRHAADDLAVGKSHSRQLAS